MKNLGELLSAFLAVSFLLAASSAVAQSTVELDSFSITPVKPKPSGDLNPASKSDLEECLLDQANCKDKELKTGKGISIDDVVNLGIVDRSEINAKAGAALISNGSKTGNSGSQSNASLPSIDMEILFDYDSDLLRPDQYARLSELAGLLGGEKFSAFRFALLGHTDAKGSASYNANLSLRRARSVAAFLRQQSNMPDGRFVTAGLGFKELKTPGDPFAPLNRRVQLVLIPVK